MNVIYFSHSYRPEDTETVAFFGHLLESRDLVPSLDPPSDTVNAAKLERHVRSCDGMIAILTRREGGVSRHILFEIALGLKARIPLLVYIEDVLPDALVPARILQRRFSRTSLPRQAREHNHALTILVMYMGENPPPKYQPSLSKRSCLIIGDDALGSTAKDRLGEFFDRQGYRAQLASSFGNWALPGSQVYDSVSSADLAIFFADTRVSQLRYVAGLADGAFVPTITFTADPSHPYSPDIPTEYQARQIDSLDDFSLLGPALNQEISTFEEDFVHLADDEKVRAYASALLGLKGKRGHYDEETTTFVQEVVMGDQYVTGQAGAVGPGSHAHRMTFIQTWEQAAGEFDLAQLQGELAQLRAAMKERAIEPEHDVAVAEVAQAEVAAGEGDGPRALEHLARAGRWALDAATAVGTTVAAAAVKVSLGL